MGRVTQLPADELNETPKRSPEEDVRSEIVTAVIVVTNELEDLRGCYTSLTAQTIENLKVVIVDNASTDGSLEWARQQESDRVKVIAAGSNLGFCPAVNLGVNAAEGDYVLALGPDVRMEPDYVERCLAAMRADPGVGIVGGKLLRALEGMVPMEPPTIDTAGHLPHRNGTVSERGHGEIDAGQYDREEEVFGINAAAVLCRAAMIEEVRYQREFLDETFWIYKDDIDVCWRAWRFGWKVKYVPSAVAYHRRGFTVTGANLERRRAIPLKMRRYSFANRYLVLVHNAPLRDIARNLLHILVYEIKAAGWIILRERELLPAYALFLRRVPRAVALRRDMRRRRRTKNDPWRRFTA